MKKNSLLLCKSTEPFQAKVSLPREGGVQKNSLLLCKSTEPFQAKVSLPRGGGVKKNTLLLPRVSSRKVGWGGGRGVKSVLKKGGIT